MRHRDRWSRRLLRGVALIALVAPAPGCGGGVDTSSNNKPAATDPDAAKRRRENADFMKNQTKKGAWAPSAGPGASTRA